MRPPRLLLTSAAVAALIASLDGHASLVLSTDVTSTFAPTTGTTGIAGNDFAGHPSELYFGQLQATQQGSVEFFYVGNEAGYTNELWLGGAAAHSTAGLADTFDGPYSLVGSIDVLANEFLDFGFCAGGAASVGSFGTCTYNNDASSLTAQFNYGDVGGYRSIGFRPVTFDVAGMPIFGSLGASDLWMIFFDDSGASNDDDHDDYIAFARFKPVSVPEPATALLLATGLAVALAGRKRRRAPATS